MKAVNTRKKMSSRNSRTRQNNQNPTKQNKTVSLYAKRNNNYSTLLVIYYVIFA